MVIFKIKLKYARINRRLSQNKLAELAGCSRVTIVNLESKKNSYTPNLKKLKTLSCVLNVSSRWLIDGGLPLEDINKKFDFLDADFKKLILQDNIEHATNGIKNPSLTAICYHIKKINTILNTGAIISEHTNDQLSQALLYIIKAYEELKKCNS